MMQQTQTYYAKSLFSDPVVLVSLLIAVFQLPEVRDVLPEPWLHLATALTAILTLFLRVYNAQRPVAAIAPGTSKPVAVASLPAQSAA